MSCYSYIFVLIYSVTKYESKKSPRISNPTERRSQSSNLTQTSIFISSQDYLKQFTGHFSTWIGLYPMWLLFVCLLIFCSCSLVCNVCPMDAWWFLYLFETGFHAFVVQSVNKLCTSHPKKPIPKYILWQILQALHFDTYDNCVEIFAYMKEFCSFLSRSLMLYIFIFRISFICGCCLFFFFG